MLQLNCSQVCNFDIGGIFMKYVAPICEILNLNEEDIIRTSDGLSDTTIIDVEDGLSTTID